MAKTRVGDTPYRTISESSRDHFLASKNEDERQTVIVLQDAITLRLTRTIKRLARLRRSPLPKRLICHPFLFISTRTTERRRCIYERISALIHENPAASCPPHSSTFSVAFVNTEHTHIQLLCLAYFRLSQNNKLTERLSLRAQRLALE